MRVTSQQDLIGQFRSATTGTGMDLAIASDLGCGCHRLKLVVTSRSVAPYRLKTLTELIIEFVHFDLFLIDAVRIYDVVATEVTATAL